jgi:hypothetical protein
MRSKDPEYTLKDGVVGLKITQIVDHEIIGIDLA